MLDHLIFSYEEQLFKDLDKDIFFFSDFDNNSVYIVLRDEVDILESHMMSLIAFIPEQETKCF